MKIITSENAIGQATRHNGYIKYLNGFYYWVYLRGSETFIVSYDYSDKPTTGRRDLEKLRRDVAYVSND